MDTISLFPHGTQVDDRNHLVIGGCDAVALAREFGTPLYVFDEATLRAKCSEYRREFAARHPDSLIIYACKAFINRALAQILKEEQLGLDVVSGGELWIGRSVDFPMDRVYLHGNNKSEEELRLALQWGVGRVVVDNFDELSLLAGLAEKAGCRQEVLLRVSPGVDPHTHAYISTGVVDSKFGFPMPLAGDAVERSMALPHIDPVGLHFHIGSQIAELEPYGEAVRIVLQFAAEMNARYGFVLSELNVGGGLAISYVHGAPPPTVGEFAEAVVHSVLKHAADGGLACPRLVVEPGRSVVGQAGVALYTVGSVKVIPGVRKYVSIDGGMADNIRPALYQARYQAVAANKVHGESERVTVAGRFCESGDVLISDIDLPRLEPGDVVAVPCCGAYCLPMGSNYNAALAPAIVMVADGKARLARRRETYEDLTRLDIV
ncbi:MAG: diaminopimelate decarboxylase [Chloroflexota bacterium]|nr:diaminopimelate decarboxylase [Chloroflexota bacterium]